MNSLMMFQGNKVEVFEFNGQVLFNPYHVGKCLDLAESSVRNYTQKMNNRQVIKLTQSDVLNKDNLVIPTSGKNFLTESGVYKLIFKSRKKEAEKFADWVTDEVLPTIRKTGKYETRKQTKALPLTEKTYKGEKVLFIKDIAEIYKVSQGGLSAMASINNIGRILKGRELRGFKNKNSKCIYNSVACIRILNRGEFIALSRCTNLKPNDEIVSYYGNYEPKQEMSLYDKLKLTDLASDILSIARRKAGNSEYYKALNLVASKIYIDCGMLDEPCDDLSIGFHIGWNLQQPLINLKAEIKNKLI